MFKFQSSIAEDEVFVDHSDKMLSSEEESIKLATGDAFLKTYTESLFKKYGRAEVTSITEHLETISNDMITNGYCSPNGKQIVKQSIAEAVKGSCSVNEFIKKNTVLFGSLDLSVEKENVADFIGETVQVSLKAITSRFEKQLKL